MLGSLAVSTAKISEKLNALIPESVNLFYGESNQNIEVINKMLRTVRNLSGFNDSRLVAFYREVVPFAYNTKQKEFTHKKKDSPITEASAIAFMKSHSWTDESFSNSRGTAVFKPENYIKLVTQKAHDNMCATDLDIMIKALIAVKKEILSKEKSVRTRSKAQVQTAQTVLA